MKKLTVILMCLFILAKVHSDEYLDIEFPDYQISETDVSRGVGFSVTENYLKEQSLKTIRKKLPSVQFDKQLPKLNIMIAKENDNGFFGYHGCSQRYRIFQDILRVVFEEALGYKIPSDFQFLRIPGDKMFDLKDGKSSFYELFDRKEPSESIKMRIVDVLFMQPFSTDFNNAVQITDLEIEDRKDLWEVALEFIEVLDSLAIEDYYSYKFENEKHARFLSLESDESNSSAYMESIRKLLGMIKQRLDSQDEVKSRAGVSESIDKLHAVFMRILERKQNKVDSNQVKAQIKLNYKFRKLFEKLEFLSYQEPEEPLWRFFFPYNDHMPGQQSRIICLNMPLFGNYYRDGESSIQVFLDGCSIAGGDEAVMELLSKFFVEIGLDKKLPVALRKIALVELEKVANNYGSILQFFDLSANNGRTPYEGADASAYVSHSYGIPLKHLEPSQLILNEHSIKRNNLDLQLRLIPCNNTTLNPNSFMRVIRYDSQDPKVSQKIIEQMRKKMKTGIVDINKLNTFKSKMDNIWSQK